VVAPVAALAVAALAVAAGALAAEALVAEALLATPAPRPRHLVPSRWTLRKA
jgi:hypothetical protein